MDKHEELQVKYRLEHFRGFTEYATLQTLRLLTQELADSEEEQENLINTLVNDWVKIAKSNINKRARVGDPIDGDVETVINAHMNAIQEVAKQVKEILHD